MAESLMPNALGDNPEEPFFDFVSTNTKVYSPHTAASISAPEDEFDVHFIFPPISTSKLHSQRVHSSPEGFARCGDDRDHETARDRGADRLGPSSSSMYGDHQPHAFSGTDGYDSIDYSGERTSRPIKETFVHIFSSTGGRIWGIFRAGCLTVLLPLPSSAVFSSRRLLRYSYLPVNLHLYSKCGADLFADLQGPTTMGASAAKASAHDAAISDDCRKAQYEAISTYRASGLMTK